MTRSSTGDDCPIHSAASGQGGIGRATPARAFELFARDLARWWPIQQFHTGPDPVTCTIEPRVGGRVFERATDGRETAWGMIVAYDPPRRLAFSWIVGGLSPDQAQLIDISFTPEGSGTRVELVHSGWEKLGDAAPSLRERYDRGWATLIEALLCRVCQHPKLSAASSIRREKSDV